MSFDCKNFESNSLCNKINLSLGAEKCDSWTKKLLFLCSITMERFVNIDFATT